MTLAISPQAAEQALAEVRWTADGLVPVIARDGADQVLMVAWMNREALRLTLNGGRMVYWSRSRARLWRKGESSGNIQRLLSLRLDCDGDVLLATIEQSGGIACHTGRASCFFRVLSPQGDWLVDQPVLRLPEELYGHSTSIKTDD